MSSSSFPGGTSITRLNVYADAAPDGLCGGSPHVHLVSTEAYVVTNGRGLLQTIDSSGFHETPLEPGVVVWFTPGTIHRAVNIDDLQIVVIMSNAGLPEAGDAVMTFPADVLGSPERYADAATLPAEAVDRERAAARRRDLAVAGFDELRERLASGELAALTDFYRAAGLLVRDRSASWAGLVRAVPLAQAEQSLRSAEAVAKGDVAHLSTGGLHEALSSEGDRGYGMCGRLRTYDVTD